MSCGHLRRHLVVTCIRACRKTKPVVGRAEAVEKCAPSHHSRAAAQPEKSCRPGSGRGLAWAPITVSPRTRFRLAILASLALLPFGMCVGGLIATRSNTGGIDVGGEFDANRAFADLKRVVSFGPRPPGSRALEQSRGFIAGELHAAGAAVVLDTFTASTPLGPVPMTSLVAKIPGVSPSIVIIAGHYDTKRMTTPFVGANDGGSSAAFLLEMARVLARRGNNVTYWLVFFDGEEALQRWSNTDGLYGSRHFAQELSAQDTLKQVQALILVDMIADAHLDIHREAHSTPWLSDIVFAEAQRFGYGRYFLNSPRAIEDDHVPFLELGVPAVDIIDLDYGPFNRYWHSPYDTVDKCSPTSLAVVAHVVLATLDALETTVSSRPGGTSS